MSEYPVSNERIARYVTHISDHFFFDDARNQDFVTGRAPMAFVSSPLRVKLLSGLITGLLFVAFSALIAFTLVQATRATLFYYLWGLLLFTVPPCFPWLFFSPGKWLYGAWLGLRYKREGQLLQGEIVSAEGKGGTNPDNPLEVELGYKVVGAHGREVYNTIVEQRKDYGSRLLPAPGTPVYVLFFNNDEHFLL